MSNAPVSPIVAMPSAECSAWGLGGAFGAKSSAEKEAEDEEEGKGEEEKEAGEEDSAGEILRVWSVGSAALLRNDSLDASCCTSGSAPSGLSTSSETDDGVALRTTFGEQRKEDAAFCGWSEVSPPPPSVVVDEGGAVVSGCGSAGGGAAVSSDDAARGAEGGGVQKGATSLGAGGSGGLLRDVRVFAAGFAMPFYSGGGDGSGRDDRKAQEAAAAVGSVSASGSAASSPVLKPHLPGDSKAPFKRR